MVPQERLLHRAGGFPRWCWGLLDTAALLLGLAFVSCTADRTPELFGTWQAQLLLEQGDTVDVNLENVSLAFAEDERYIYTSTLDHLEAGRYRLEGDLLTTTADTTAGTGPQRVRVVLLDSARLHLLMMDRGKERRLEFARINLTAPPPPSAVKPDALLDSTLLQSEENFDEEDFGGGEAVDDDHGH